MGISLEALRSFPYAGRAVRAGHLFEAKTKADAKLLTQIGHARIPVRAKRVEADPEPEQPEGDPRPRRTYRRRDLTAESE